MSKKTKKKTEESVEEGVIVDETGEEEVEEQEGVTEGMSAERDPAPIIKDSTPTPDPLAASLEKQITAMGKKTAEKLKSCTYEKIKIPMDDLNPKETFVIVGINGWNLQIQRGVAVNLPIPVVDLLEAGGYNPTRVR